MLSKKSFEAGANPFLLEQLGVLGSGVSQPPMKPGTIVEGDAKAEYVLCVLTLAAAATLTPGQVYQHDKDFNASLLTTATAVQGQSVGVGLVSQTNVPAGTYYIWLQINGHAPIACTGAAAALCETTATAGVVNFVNASTAGSRKVATAALYQANVAFTGATADGSNVVSALAAAAPNSLDDLSVGATVTGNGIPANTTIAAINGSGSTRTLTLSANATASAAGVALTAAGVLNANLVRPTIGTAN